MFKCAVNVNNCLLKLKNRIILKTTVQLCAELLSETCAPFNLTSLWSRRYSLLETLLIKAPIGL